MHARIMRNLIFYLKMLENDKIQLVTLCVRFARPQECEEYVTINVKKTAIFCKILHFNRWEISISLIDCST